MTFDEEVTPGGAAACEVDDFEWQGVVKSETVYFQVQASSEVNMLDGSAETKIKPDVWNLKWKDDTGQPKKIKVEIKVEGQLTLDDIEAQSIKLNNLTALKVKRTASKIETEFDRKLVVESLGDVEANQMCRVLISGRFKSGAPFGAEQQIRIIK
jgi:hypothetical protein